jgi:hypothetical protein
MMFNLPPNQFDRAQWEKHRGGRNEGNTVATMPVPSGLTTQLDMRANMDPNYVAPARQVDHRFFNADGATDKPADFTPQMATTYAMGPQAAQTFSPEMADRIRTEQGARWGFQGVVGRNPYEGGVESNPFPYAQKMQDGSMVPYQAWNGGAAAGTGSATPQAINQNRLMTASQPWGERRDPVVPLQGYQNALLGGI